jgi:hypothetical protein
VWFLAPESSFLQCVRPPFPPHLRPSLLSSVLLTPAHEALHLGLQIPGENGQNHKKHLNHSSTVLPADSASHSIFWHSSNWDSDLTYFLVLIHLPPARTWLLSLTPLVWHFSKAFSFSPWLGPLPSFPFSSLRNPFTHLQAS